MFAHPSADPYLIGVVQTAFNAAAPGGLFSVKRSLAFQACPSNLSLLLQHLLLGWVLPGAFLRSL